MEPRTGEKKVSTRVFYIVLFTVIIILTFVVAALKEMSDRLYPDTKRVSRFSSEYVLETSYIPPVYDKTGTALSFGNGILRAQDLIRIGKNEEAKRILFILSLYYPDSILVKQLQDENNAKMKKEAGALP